MMPGVTTRSRVEWTVRLPSGAFHMRGRALAKLAFAAHGWGARVRRRPGERVWRLADGTVVGALAVRR